MDVDEDELIGEPLDQVPKQESTDQNCMGRRLEKEDGEKIFRGYCRAWPGKGTDHVGEGRCSKHGGAGGAPEDNNNAEDNDGGAPEENTNAVKHGLYAKTNRFYQDVIDGDLQTLCDKIFEDYLKQYREVHGEPPTGHEARLFEIAVNHIKIIHGDNWASERPDELDSGNPIVDRETKQTKYELRVEYSESVVVGTQQKLRREDRAWLKDMGLLEDPESQKADAISEMKDAWKTSAQESN